MKVSNPAPTRTVDVSHSSEKAMSLLVDAGFKLKLSEFLNPPASCRDNGRFAILASAA
jgi:hypothetical protein